MKFLNNFKDEKQSRNLSNVNATDKQALSIFGVNQDGVTVNDNTSMRHTTVYACVNVKAQGLSSVPLNFFKDTKNGREKAKNHPLYKILHDQVNPLMTSSTWREMVVQDIELRGTHYSQIVRNNGGKIVAIYPLINDNMEIDLTVSKSNIPTIKYKYTIKEGSPRNFKNNDILRIVGLPSSNGIVGVTPIGQNAKSIGLAMETEEFGSKFFQNGANGSGILSTDGEFKTQEAVDRIKQQFGEKYVGLANSKKPIVLEAGLKWQPITISNNDSQFLETRQYQKSDIASIFRVSPHLINDLTNATYANITELSLEHIKFCLMPVAVRIEAAIWMQLLTEEEQGMYFSEFDFNGMARGDFKSRMEGYDLAIKGGFMKPNEARKKENLDTSENAGDKLIMQTSYDTLENIEKGDSDGNNS
jgi:HK97 family phage portal protein